MTAEQATCGYQAYAASEQPQFFALGTGVAGGKLTSTNSQGARAAADGFGVIAWNNQNLTVLGNGKGIDHLDASGIFPALMAAAATCGIVIPED